MLSGKQVKASWISTQVSLMLTRDNPITTQQKPLSNVNDNFHDNKCLFCDQTKLKRFHVRHHKNKRTCWYKAMQFMQILCINVILQIHWSLAFFQITKFCLVIVILYYRYSIYEKLCVINKHISNLCLVIWFHLFSMWNMPLKQFEKRCCRCFDLCGGLIISSHFARF